MKQIYCTCILFFVSYLLIRSLSSGFFYKSHISLTPMDKREVCMVQVKDATEAVMLQEKLNLEIVKIEDSLLYFYDQNNSITRKLEVMGYDINDFDSNHLAIVEL